MTAKMESRSRGDIGERLIIARKKRGLSQDALARLLTPPVSQGAIAHIESGRIESSRHLVWIAAALKIRAEWLVTVRLRRIPSCNSSRVSRRRSVSQQPCARTPERLSRDGHRQCAG